MDPAVVVGVDFGTTYSGFSFSHCANPAEVLCIENWPLWDEAGGRPYCKTQTSLFYSLAGSGSSLDLQGWGWPALVKYTKALQHVKPDQSSTYKFSGRDTKQDDFVKAVQITGKENDVGYFVTKFKLMLAPDYDAHNLPCGLSPQKLISDYLRCMSEFALENLKVKYGNHLKKSNIQWCITVPALWDERAKQRMKICCEMAGMVQGKCCSDIGSSPHPLRIVLEPEAASMYCQDRLHEIPLKSGDKFMVVDIGGGTIDLVLHQSVNPKLCQVQEAAITLGEMGGGSFVDSNFFQYLDQEIDCFKDFILQNPKYFLRVRKWWLDKKCCFTGPSSEDGIGWDVPCKLASAWKASDRSKQIFKQDDEYEEMDLSPQVVQQFFDTEVSKTISLIRKQLGSLEGGEKCKCLLVVGGLSENSYMINQIKEEFGGDVERIIVPVNPASAILHGAVKFGFHSDLVLSRKSKKFYGIESSSPFKQGDTPSYRWIDDDGKAKCYHFFSMYVCKNQSIPVDYSIKNYFYPCSHKQTKLRQSLFSSDGECPDYTTDKGCVKENSYVMDISQDLHLDKKRKIEVKMYFGKSTIEVTGRRVNFGDRKPETLYFVELQ